MRIALVAPAPVPDVVGGAENLYAGLHEYLDRQSGHRCDLIKLPVRETSLADLVAGYEAFSRLDLSEYDAVISTKYPAWMVSHPNHRVYMLHTCRGFYDWYPAAQVGGYRYLGSDPGVAALLHFMRVNRMRRSALAEFFDRFRELATREDLHEMRQHPGPVGRAVIRFLDSVGLAPAAIRRYAAIAGTVTRREGYFPAGAKPLVLHPPTQKTGWQDTGQDHFFTVSRFYPSKRIDLLVDAYRLARVPLPFRIAGTGGEEALLRSRAGDDPRFSFEGFVDDAALVRLYGGALGVPFAPADEDYGYVALEAMLAGKPVITTDDAGGPLELVRDGENGLVTAPRPDALAAAFERLYADRQWARKLGARGREEAMQVGWPAVVAGLLSDEPAPTAHRPPVRPRVTVLNSYAVHPPQNGGQYRIHWLYRSLARHVDVDLVTLGTEDEGSGLVEVAPGFRELRVGRSAGHAAADRALQLEAQMPVHDITALGNIALTPDYAVVLGNSLAASRLAVLAHPYMANALRASGWQGPFVHESQNREHELKSRMLADDHVSRRLLGWVEEAERFCCRDSALVYAASVEDALGLVEQYGGKPDDTIVVPNGTDTSGIIMRSEVKRARLRCRLRLGAAPVALFLASGHRPNLEAAEHLFKLAERMPDVNFAFVGNIAAAYPPPPYRVFPPNVWLVGTVSEEERNLWLELADVALNPMIYGGGTNLKLLDYFAAGVPVVSTAIGLRGSGAEDGVHARVAAIEDLEAPVRAILGDPAGARAMAERARGLVEERFDWWKLGERLHEAIVARGLL